MLGHANAWPLGFDPSQREPPQKPVLAVDPKRSGRRLPGGAGLLCVHDCRRDVALLSGGDGPPAHPRHSGFSLVSFRRGRGSGTQPVRGRSHPGLLCRRFSCGGRVFVCELARHRGPENYRCCVAGVKSSRHVDRRKLEARLRRGCSASANGGYLRRQVFRQMASVYMAEGESALLHFFVRISRPYSRRALGHISSRRKSLTVSYFPMQNVLKIKLRMSSVVVAPVIASSGRSAL